MPSDLWTGALRELVVAANVDASNAERFAREYERDPRDQDPQVKARFLGLYRQEARFQRLLADQLAEIQAGARAALDLSGLTPQEMEAFRQFLRDEVSRMDLGRTRILHPDYAIRDLSVKQSLLRRCSLKGRLCSYLLEHLAVEGTSVKLARQAEGG